MKNSIYDCLPKQIKDKIINKNIENINIGCSDSSVYKINTYNEEKTMYLKIASESYLTTEYKALKWLENKLMVPKVIFYECYNSKEYLLTESLNGKMLCDDFYLKNPDAGIEVLAEAFKKIYNVDIANCPVNVGLDYKLDKVKKNVEEKLLNEDDVSLEYLNKYDGVEGILSYLLNNKFEEDLCFSHGDTSLPNIFAEGNKFIGFIDVGECGIADKWFDLAICEKSIKRNFGDKYIDLFYKKINVIPDRKKIDYYILLMELYL